MILYLFGGWRPQITEKAHYELIFNCLEEINPQQLLYFGFAEGELSLEQKFTRFRNRLSMFKSLEILSADNKQDLEKINDPIIFIGGGRDHKKLFSSINNNRELLKIVLSAKYLFGDSAGSMVAGSRQRSLGGPSELMDGLGILKNTVIEPHYSQRNRQQLLRDEMNKENIQYGIGIDEATCIRIETLLFPDKWEKRGKGKVEVVDFKKLK